MQLDGRLSRMLHVLIHMDRIEGPITSAQAAQMLHTNPVVVRRTMAGLREAGFVRSEKGHAGVAAGCLARERDDA
jgi:DNA-binding IscR family transcriptional regulator